VLAAEGKKIGGNGTVGGLLAGENSRLWEMTVGRFCAEKKRKMVIKGGGGSAGKEEGLGSRGPLPTAVRKNQKSKILLFFFVAGDEQK